MCLRNHNWHFIVVKSVCWSSIDAQPLRLRHSMKIESFNLVISQTILETHQKNGVKVFDLRIFVCRFVCHNQSWFRWVDNINIRNVFMGNNTISLLFSSQRTYAHYQPKLVYAWHIFHGSILIQRWAHVSNSSMEDAKEMQTISKL